MRVERVHDIPDLVCGSTEEEIEAYVRLHEDWLEHIRPSRIMALRLAIDRIKANLAPQSTQDTRDREYYEKELALSQAKLARLEELKTSPAHLTAEFQELIKHPDIEAIHARELLLEIDTGKIVVRHKRQRFHIGKFRIRLTGSYGRSGPDDWVQILNRTQAVFSGDNVALHPHIGYSGTPCFGGVDGLDTYDVIHDLGDEIRLGAVVILLIEFLKSVNQSGTYFNGEPIKDNSGAVVDYDQGVYLWPRVKRWW